MTRVFPAHAGLGESFEDQYVEKGFMSESWNNASLQCCAVFPT